ncbi:hypothetical protein ACK1X7_35205 [Streptomyces sp. CY1]|uniref:hypothetical protein n=1 Tax=Streptomyces sp. CY1 TaxID=3388313 RepID=UPI0039A33C6F
MVLETSWEALEHGGIAPGSLAGRRPTGAPWSPCPAPSCPTRTSTRWRARLDADDLARLARAGIDPLEVASCAWAAMSAPSWPGPNAASTTSACPSTVGGRPAGRSR